MNHGTALFPCETHNWFGFTVTPA